MRWLHPRVRLLAGERDAHEPHAAPYLRSGPQQSLLDRGNLRGDEDAPQLLGGGARDGVRADAGARHELRRTRPRVALLRADVGGDGHAVGAEQLAAFHGRRSLRRSGRGGSDP